MEPAQNVSVNSTCMPINIVMHVQRPVVGSVTVWAVQALWAYVRHAKRSIINILINTVMHVLLIVNGATWIQEELCVRNARLLGIGIQTIIAMDVQPTVYHVTSRDATSVKKTTICMQIRTAMHVELVVQLSVHHLAIPVLHVLKVITNMQPMDIAMHAQANAGAVSQLQYVISASQATIYMPMV